MIYNEYTISIERFSMIYKTGKLSLLSVGGILPGYVLKGKFAAIIKFLNDILGVEKPDMIKEIIKEKMSNLINNFFPNLYNALLLNPTKEMIDLYKSYFGKAPETKEDLQRILKEQEKQIKIFKSLYPDKKIEPDQEFDFDAFINGLELTRGIHINRKDMLYTLGPHYKSAIELNRERQKVAK